ncbi:MAG: hypothetical protein RLY70_2035 [Planctomycetota bacterium]|jgi:hypothetical protein
MFDLELIAQDTPPEVGTYLRDWAQRAIEDPTLITRAVFNYFLTPLAVITVFRILIKNIVRVIRVGFASGSMEGYQRTCVAILPFSFFVYAMVGGDGTTDLVDSLRALGTVKLFVGGMVAGGAAALEVFHIVDHKHALLDRLLLLYLSGIACFTSYMFLGVGIGPGINIAFGLLIGICVVAIFANLRGAGNEIVDNGEVIPAKQNQHKIGG